MKAWRIVLAVLGVAAVIYGASMLITHVSPASLVWLGVWMIAALIIHDGVLSPLILAIGALLRRFVPDRARRFLQIALLSAAMITVIALPLIYRRNSQPPSKAMLLQNYVANLGLLLGLVGGLVLILYAIRVARARQLGPEPE
jgi:hypothetical protein